MELLTSYNVRWCNTAGIFFGLDFGLRRGYGGSTAYAKKILSTKLKLLYENTTLTPDWGLTHGLSP